MVTVGAARFQDNVLGSILTRALSSFNGVLPARPKSKIRVNLHKTNMSSMHQPWDTSTSQGTRSASWNPPDEYIFHNFCGRRHNLGSCSPNLLYSNFGKRTGDESFSTVHLYERGCLRIAIYKSQSHRNLEQTTALLLSRQ